ncbi:hypothetical protein JB92DRAFT_3275059 [Gautieria morchelliformis]|nr:hypothetical protein JB92DRAFT_3275059 [Gautieria morchelliformis]
MIAFSLNNSNSEASQNQPHTSTTFLEIIHHPHSNQQTEFIFRDLPIPPPSEDYSRPQSNSTGKPWAPFRTRSDFEFAELVVQSAMKGSTVKRLLKGIRHDWTEPGSTKITFQNKVDFQKSMAAARKFNTQEDSISATFEGIKKTFDFHFRDPWKWLLHLVTDPTLASSIIYYPVKKILHENGTSTRLYDEINSGQTWWDIQDQMPYLPDLPHCFLPLHLWMDKGKVSTTSNMHPILLRAGFLPQAIRNGSGNGGGVIDPSDPEDRTATEKTVFGLFKREVYHKILKKIFHSLELRSQEGEAVKCGDEIHRVLFPGIAVHSLDGEEAYATCAARGASADYPCPCCLIHKSQLHNLTGNFPFRTSREMQKVYKKAIAARTKAEAEEVLKKKGLHKVLNAFWSIANSDPYHASSYDLLHADDLGKWGKHLFVLLKVVSGSMKKKGDYSQNMDKIPRWPGLKHFSSITTLEFSDGQSYFDALKCVLPCIVQLFPLDSPLIHCIHAYSCFRMLAGLHAMTEIQLERMLKYLEKYQYCCSKLETMYGKDFNFPKQHTPHDGLIRLGEHLHYDITHKGATNNYTTRVGEGFQQEVQQAYLQTNFKNVEAQMTRIDEDQEAIASIRMAVDAYDLELQSQIEEGTENKPAFRNFHKNLIGYLRETFSEDIIDGTPLKITPYRCLYIHYKSQEDWNICQDIIRCSPSFHGQPRYDCIIINTEPVTYACICFLFTCHLDLSTSHDMALIQLLRPTKWRPKTPWETCQVYGEQDYRFLLLRYIEGLYYLNDLIDADMFLRCGN